MPPSRLPVCLVSASLIMGAGRGERANEGTAPAPRSAAVPPQYVAAPPGQAQPVWPSYPAPAYGNPGPLPPPYPLVPNSYGPAPASSPYSAPRAFGAPSYVPPFDPRLPLVTLQVNRRNARLQWLEGPHWEDVCFSPCNFSLSPAATYRVGGGSAMDSEPFSLPDRPGPVLIDARGGSKFGYWTGVGLGVGGAAFTLAGLSFLLEGASMSKSDPTSLDGENASRQVAITLGVVAVIVGVIVGAVGLGIWHRNKMKVEVH